MPRAVSRVVLLCALVVAVTRRIEEEYQDAEGATPKAEPS